MDQRRRLPEVTQPFAPLTKHRATATLRTVAAALLLVAWRIISVRGLWVGDARRRSRSTKQKSMTKIKTIPLRIFSTFPYLRFFREAYVTPPTRTAATIAWGASLDGRGISSVMCATASKLHLSAILISYISRSTHPIILRADWSSPSIQAVPSLHPVVLEKLVKTNLASVLGEVESSTILMTTTLIKDQYTGIV